MPAPHAPAMIRALAIFTNLFPVWVLAASLLALVRPHWFTWFSGEAIVFGLAVIMLGMGITLSVEDFKRVLKLPKAVALGFGAQFVIMPTLGYTLAKVLQLPPPFAVGLILVSCCPGGTASNVVSYLARANVALSVLMTMCSTFGAVVLTPLLTKLLAGQIVEVDAWKLFLNTVQVVLVPVLAGLGLHHALPRVTRAILPVAPPIAVLAIVLIVASIIGQRAEEIIEHAGLLLAAVGLLHAGGFGLGYLAARLLGYGALVRRTVSIEVGMQNSGLGAVLARNNFADPLTAVPSALSSVMHSVMGSALAGLWRWRTPTDPTDRTDRTDQTA